MCLAGFSHYFSYTYYNSHSTLAGHFKNIGKRKGTETSADEAGLPQGSCFSPHKSCLVMEGFLEELTEERFYVQTRVRLADYSYFWRIAGGEQDHGKLIPCRWSFSEYVIKDGNNTPKMYGSHWLQEVKYLYRSGAK